MKIGQYLAKIWTRVYSVSFFWLTVYEEKPKMKFNLCQNVYKKILMQYRSIWYTQQLSLPAFSNIWKNGVNSLLFLWVFDRYFVNFYATVAEYSPFSPLYHAKYSSNANVNGCPTETPTYYPYPQCPFWHKIALCLMLLSKVCF